MVKRMESNNHFGKPSIKHTPEWTNDCRDCGQTIGWNRKAIGRNGRLYPLDTETGERHNCPNSDYVRRTLEKPVTHDDVILAEMRSAVNAANQKLQGVRLELTVRQVIA
jgi:hypothetical protein